MIFSDHRPAWSALYGSIGVLGARTTLGVNGLPTYNREPKEQKYNPKADRQCYY